MADAAFSQAITNAYKQYLGRDPEAGIVDWRAGQASKFGSESLAKQINDIMNSSEAKSYSSAQQQAQAAAAKAKADAANAERQQLTGQVNGLFGDLTSADGAMKNPVDIYNAALEGLGLADARTRASGLREQLMNTENLLKNVEGDISGRTSESNITEGQRRRLVAGEQAPLAGQIDIFNSALGNATADYQNILTEGKTQADLTYQGEQAKRQAIMDRLKIAIDRSNSAEDKARWQAEFDRLQQQDAESKRQFDLKLALEQQAQAMAASKATSGGGGGRSSGGGSSSSSSNPSPQDIIQYYITANSNYGAYNPNSTNYHRWQAAEQALQQAGYNPGSAAIKKLTTAAFGSPSERKALGV